MEYRKHPERTTNHLLSIPFIYMMIIPLVIFDIMLEIYHRICFPLYGMHCLQRSSYIRLDRQRLTYLRWYDKINCTYCGYANGLLRYACAIASETEQYWCAIKHQTGKGVISQNHQKKFVKFGDEKSFKKKFN